MDWYDWCWRHWCYWEDTDFGHLPEWLTGIGTITLAVVTVFLDSIKAALWHPQLAISIRPSAPDCLGTTRGAAPGIPTFYARIWVENKGNRSAADVEVSGIALKRERDDASGWETIASFTPMNFVWADTSPATIYWSRIAPGMGKHCDLVEIVEPDALRQYLQAYFPPYRRPGLNLEKTTMRFVLAIQPNHGLNIVGPGRYQIDLAIAAKDLDPIRRTVELTLTGDWYRDDAEMLRHGLTGLRVLTE